MRWWIIIPVLISLLAISCGRGDTDKAIAYLSNGNLKYEAGDFEGAIEEYNKALEWDPKIANIFLQRGMAKFALKDMDGAFEDCTKAIKLVPAFTHAYVERATIYYLKGEYQKAEEDLQKALEVNPEMESALTLLAHVKASKNK